jgi:hypothetical protein
MKSGLLWLILVLLAGSVAPAVGCKSQSVSKSEAEQNPLACALFIAERMSEGSPELLARAAGGFAQAGDCERALRIASSMNGTRWLRSDSFDASIKADSLGSVFVECSRLGDALNAEKSYAAALRIIEGIPKDKYGEELSRALTNLAMKQASLGNDREAVRLIDRAFANIGRKEKDSVNAGQAQSLIEAANNLAIVGKHAQSRNLVDNALKIGWTINDTSLRSDVWISAAEFFMKRGENERGKDLLSQGLTIALKSTDDGSFRDDQIRRVANVHALAGEFDRAEQTIALLSLEYKRSWAWRDIAVKVAESGDCTRAKALSEKISGFSDKADALKAIVAKYAETGDLAKAIEIADLTKSFLNRADARLTVAQKYAQINDRANAEKFLNLALDDVQRETGDSDYAKQRRLAQIALEFVGIGDRERAATMLKKFGQMEASGSSLVDLANVATARGDYELAIEITRAIATDTHIDDVGTITKEFYRAEALINLLLKYAEAKRKGMDQEKNIQQMALKALGWNQ